MTRVLASFAVLLMTFVCALPWGLSQVAGPAAVLSAALPIAVVFACGFWWPDRLPSWVAFLAGVFSDAATGGPLGYWALLYLLALTAARTSHAMFQTPGLLAAWLAFALTTGLLSIVAWSVTSLYRLELAAWPPVAWPLLGLAVVFPVIGGVLLALIRWTEGRRSLSQATGEQK